MTISTRWGYVSFSDFQPATQMGIMRSSNEYSPPRERQGLHWKSGRCSQKQQGLAWGCEWSTPTRISPIREKPPLACHFNENETQSPHKTERSAPSLWSPNSSPSLLPTHTHSHLSCIHSGWPVTVPPSTPSAPSWGTHVLSPSAHPGVWANVTPHRGHNSARAPLLLALLWRTHDHVV